MQTAQKQLYPLFQNVGGLNTSDSTFTVKDSQATGGYNYDYVRTGGILKSLGPQRLNSVADVQLRTLGLFLRHTKTGTKSIIRAAGTKIQLTDLLGTFTNLTEDTVTAASDFFISGSTQPVMGKMFTGANSDVLWLTGGGSTLPLGVYSDSKVTTNGVPAPTGTVTATETPTGGAWPIIGPYYYALAYHKASTGMISNAGVDVLGTVTNVTNSITLDWSGLTNLDSTKYDTIYIVRSVVNGVSAFTAGDIVAIVSSSTTSYVDSGSYISTGENIPRPGNVILDNSTLPAGTYTTITIFKRRLVVASESTIYLSDIDKPESWPLTNIIPIPSGGPITAQDIISYTPNATSTDEFLASFKEGELWVLSGNNVEDWALKFVDFTGSLGPGLVTAANGYLYFIDNRGIYIWDGVGKPYYCSRLIEDLFGVDGKLDRTKLTLGHGVFFKRQNEIVWYVSHNDIGEQKLLLKMDLRLTLPQLTNALGQRIIDGVFLQGKINNPAYAAATFVFPTSASQEDVLISGDDAGYVYRQFYDPTGVGANDYDFTYDTKFLDCNSPNVDKSFYTVYAWVENVGDWKLYLDYWTNWRTLDEEKSTAESVINPSNIGTTALWDVGKWDQAKWDGFTGHPLRIAFNLNAAAYNNAQGEVIKLRFRNQNSNEPVTIYGFAISWSPIGVSK